MDLTPIRDELLPPPYFEFKTFLGVNDSPGHLGCIIPIACSKAGLAPHVRAIKSSISGTIPPELQALLHEPASLCRVGVLNAPPEYIDSLSAPYKICLTYWESDKCSQEWVDGLNRFDEVWVISEFNRQVLVDSGVTKPVRKIRVGVDRNEYFFCPYRRPEYVFGMAGRLSYRKGVDIAARAFRRAFPSESDVLLEIKTRVNNIATAVHDMAELGDTRIKVINEEWDVPQLRQWYGSLNVYLNPSRCEGFSLTPLEAAACGATPIVTDWGGCQEFLREPFISLPTSGKMAAVGMSGGHWAVPDEDALVELMKMCYNERVDRGQECSDYVLREWPIENVAEDIKERLVDIVGGSDTGTV